MEYFEEGCRLCLTTDKSRSYYFLLDLEHLEALSQYFSLDSDLKDTTLHPKHICDECNLVINRFLKLKKIATQNDKFVMKYQAQIQSRGIRGTVRTERNSVEERKENNENVENNLENGSSVDDDYNLKEEPDTLGKEYEEEIHHIMEDDSRMIDTNIHQINWRKPLK